MARWLSGGGGGGFTLDEFFRSVPDNVATAFKNDTFNGTIARLRCLCVNLLQPLREEYGASIYISSGVRTHEDTARILKQGGHPSQTSDHLVASINPRATGAADIYAGRGGRPDDDLTQQLFDIARRFTVDPSVHYPVGQLILETRDDTNAWVHIANDFPAMLRHLRLVGQETDGLLSDHLSGLLVDVVGQRHKAKGVFKMHNGRRSSDIDPVHG